MQGFPETATFLLFLSRRMSIFKRIKKGIELSPCLGGCLHTRGHRFYSYFSGGIHSLFLSR